MGQTFHDKIESVAPVLASCGVASNMSIQSEIRLGNSRNTKGMGYIGGDADSVSTESFSRPTVFDLFLLQIEFEFRIV